jgi:hypothetical protein
LYEVFLSIFVDFLDAGLITDWYKGKKGVDEEPNHTIARKKKPGPLNPPKLLSKNPPNTAHASFAGFLITYSQRKTCEVLTRYRVDTGEDS